MDPTCCIYACFEPQRETYARRLDTWAWTNSDVGHYNDRRQFAPEDPHAEPHRVCLRQQIQEADVTVCVIALQTYQDSWIAWELQASRAAANGLVGVMLNELDRQPPAMVGCGAIFVPFRRDIVERAVHWSLTHRDASGDFTLRDF